MPKERQKQYVPWRTIKITREILAKSQPNSASHCMIAEALRTMGARAPKVTADTVSFNMDRKHYIYSLPAKAAVELVRFDEKGAKAVQPFKFLLQGNCGTAKDLIIGGPVKRKKKPGPKVKRAKRGKSKSPRRVVRRISGIRVIEVPIQAA